MWSISSLCVLRTSLVMSASTPSTSFTERSGYLYDALFGGRLSDRLARDTSVHRLDVILKAVPAVLKRELGDTEATSQAILELNRVAQLPTTSTMAVYAKRAAVLYALWRERDIQHYFRTYGERELVDDLCTRILPLVMPRFVATQCQHPDVAVIMTTVMLSMWGREDLCTVKRNTPETHHRRAQ